VNNALKEWNRVLKPGGNIFITDYHPDSLGKGGKRTFKKGTKTIAVKSYVYPVALIRKLAGQLGWTERRYMQKDIDETTQSYYLQKNALDLFDKFRGTPLVYAIHFVKK
jgi:ubiquinone/menaquinone biosynthesis C-methylase UbiE